MALIHITKDNYDTEVLNSGKTVLLDFYADWCVPCRMIVPTLEEIAKEYPHITVGKVNVDKDMELAMQYKVASIPLLVVLHEGRIVNKSLGVVSKEEIIELLP